MIMEFVSVMINGNHVKKLRAAECRNVILRQFDQYAQKKGFTIEFETEDAYAYKNANNDTMTWKYVRL